MKVLFVVTAFFPQQAIGSIRVTKFVKYLQEQGVSVSVISLTPPPWAVRDETLWFDGLDKIEWHSIDQSPLFNRVFQRARVATVGTGAANAGTSAWSAGPTVKSRLRAAAQLGYTLLKAVDWSFRVRKHAREHFSGKTFDFIFCSYPSFASPLSGMKLKKMRIGKNLAVDFRDPIVTTKPGRFSLRLWLQRRILHAADLKFFVSQGVRQKIAGDAPTMQDHIASNGFDLEDTPLLVQFDQNILSGEILRFVYTGAMYGGKRNLRPFFEATATVLSRSSHAPEQIRIEYAGAEGDIFLSQATEFGLGDRVVNHGSLSRSDALNLQQQADVCLLATWNSLTEQGVLTGKVFEYFLVKKPIIAIVGGNLAGSEISKVITKIGAGHSYESAVPESIIELEDWIESALDEKQISGNLSSRYNENVNDFDIKNVAECIHEKMANYAKLDEIP